LADLKVVNTISMSTQGISVDGKQGTAANPAATPLTITVSGTVHKVIGTLTSGTEVLAYDAGATDYPATWDYMFFWCDQKCQIQLITGATEVTIEAAQYAPQVLSTGKHLASAGTGANSAEATLAAITSINLGQYSGSTANYVLILVD
jgi:hypothetical protein